MLKPTFSYMNESGRQFVKRHDTDYLMEEYIVVGKILIVKSNQKPMFNKYSADSHVSPLFEQ